MCYQILEKIWIPSSDYLIWVFVSQSIAPKIFLESNKYRPVKKSHAHFVSRLCIAHRSVETLIGSTLDFIQELT